MEAANRGAREAGGRSVGCNIELPKERAPNAYLDRSVTWRHFFVRKVLLFKYSYAFIGLPGGLGTLDELFEALTLIQTGKIAHFPVVLIGTAYWRPLQDLLLHLASERTIDEADLALLLDGDLTIPDRALGVVVFAHGSGSSRFSGRNRAVAQILVKGGFASLLLDLLTQEEEAVDLVTREYRFDVARLGHRVVGAVDWVMGDAALSGLPIACALVRGSRRTGTGIAAGVGVVHSTPAEIASVTGTFRRAMAVRPRFACAHLVMGVWTSRRAA
jgi:hypothetical protein